MEIYINDTRPAIGFTINGVSTYILKSVIKEVAVVADDVVKIDIGDPRRNIYLKLSEVMLYNEGANYLAEVITAMIRECLCDPPPDF